MAGDDYQHLFTWLQALKLLREHDRVERIVMEARNAGNVDDVVVHRRGRPNVFHQVKFVVDHRAPLTHEWFTTPGDAKHSPLQRFYESSQKLSTPEHPAELALVTNRPKAGDDPLFKLVSGRDATLGQRVAAVASSSKAGKIRAAWADHLGIPVEDLVAMLDHLRVHAGLDDYVRLRENCGYLMEAVGLAGDADAVERGREEIRRMIIEERCRELDVDRLRELIVRKELQPRPARATLLIQAINRHPLPEAATAHVDWVDFYIGDEPRARRRLTDPDLWNSRLRPELRDAAARALQHGPDVLLAGHMRLSAAFAAGVELSDVAKAKLTVITRDGEWTTEEVAEVALAAVVEDVFDLGDDLAVGLSITNDLHADVVEHIDATRLPISRLITLAPAAGASGSSVASAAVAMGLTVGIRNAVRAAAKQTRGNVHLFMAAPLVFAAFLGHVWNRVPPTQFYEEASATGGYQPTFFIPA
jgi:hypothetical protein